MEPRRFAIRYSPRLRWLFELAGLGPRHSIVERRRDALVVRMGWAFSAVVPVRDIADVSRERDVWWAIGVHTNFSGSWLVNGAATGIVKLELAEPVRGRSAGFEVAVRTLGLGLDDPDGFMATFGARA
jgi:hypothetical protein